VVRITYHRNTSLSLKTRLKKEEAAECGIKKILLKEASNEWAKFQAKSP